MGGLDIGQLVNAGAGLVSLYLAIQIKLIVKNHEGRIRKLEEKPRRTKPKKKKII